MIVRVSSLMARVSHKKRQTQTHPQITRTSLRNCGWLELILIVLACCFDVRVRAFASRFCFVIAQTKVLQCLSQASPVSESVENGVRSNVGKPSVEVLAQTHCGDVVSKAQIRICREGCLITTAQIVGVRMQRARQIRMVAQIVVSVTQV